MPPETEEPPPAQAGGGRSVDGERSPGGSVKRARQRAAAGLPPEPPEIPSSILTDSSRDPSPPHSSSDAPPQYPQPPSVGSPHTSSPPRSVPSDGSRPGQGQDTGLTPERGLGRGQMPQHPHRPNVLPPIAPSSGRRDDQPAPLQFRKPQTQGQPQPARNYWDDNFTPSPGGSSDSRPSTFATGSSTASIPDFPTIPSMPSTPSLPAPAYQPPPRRNLGPPPSARKGGNSYYSQNSFVPPIPEEMSDARSSNASSHVVPVSWGDGPPEYHLGSGIDDDEEDDDESAGGNGGREPRVGDHDDETNLVRKGSHGKPRRQYLETVEDADESERGDKRDPFEMDRQTQKNARWRPSSGAPPRTDPIGRHNFRNNGNLQLYSGYESDATFLDSPRSASPNEMPKALKINNTSNPYFSAPSSIGSPVDPKVGEILTHLEKGGAIISSGTVSPMSPKTPLVNEKALKRPPPLNLEASKPGPGRGSASSLPELIKRATRLASNLDRGKTASRVGMLDVLNEKDKQKHEAGKASRDGSISDILAAFPSPSPTTAAHPDPSNWPTPSPHGKSNLSRAHTVTYSSSRSDRGRGRRCCGMPIWAFILLIIILVLLVAAAIVIPVTLIVVPRQHSDGPSLATCQKTNPCANGGTALVLNQTCRCICANGYTGSTCDAPVDIACTTMDLTQNGTTTVYNNATLGSSIPRLLTAAQQNYSIPLSGYTLASLFSMSNLTCSSENALVIFNQKSQRRHLHSYFHSRNPSTPPPAAPVPIDLAQLLHPSPTTPAKKPTPILRARASAQTSNNIIFAAGGNGVPAPGSPPAAPSPVTQSVLDFARTAVLFIFQETSSLATATTALDKLQRTIGTGTTFDASVTSAGGNVTVDLGLFTVGFGNGTFWGEKQGA